MVAYNRFDVFYDYEVLQNVTTNAMLYPGAKKIIIPYNTHMDSIQPGDHELHVTPDDEQWIRDYVIEQNKSSLRRWGVPEDNVQLTSNFVGEIVQLNTVNKRYTLPYHGGTMFGYNSSGYDVAITAFLLDEINELLKSNKNDPKAVNISAKDVRQFSDALINGPSKSPWQGVRDYGDQYTRRSLFNTFATLMNNPYNIDVQSLNAKMSKTALKRLAAQGGFKIETSDKLSEQASTLHSVEELAELLAYNVNDIFATLWLFEQKPYQTPYNQRITLIDRYGDNQFKDKNIKRDSTEAKLIENVISPRESLTDDPEVSLAYPVTRGYMPDSFKNPDFTLEQANALYNHLEDVAKKSHPALFNENPSKAMNMYLFEKYEEEKDRNPEHLIVKHFFFKNGSNKIMASNGEFVYTADGYKGFNRTMLSALGEYILNTGNRETNDAQKQLNLQEKDDLMKRASPNDNTPEVKWDETVNTVIEHIAEDHPFYPWFYYEDGMRKVVAKDKRLMVDLLNYVSKHYNLPQDVYTYYDAYRGQDMGVRDASKAVKAQLEKDGYKHLKSGAAVLLTPESPVYVTMSIGGVHGNLIDLEKYKEDKATADTYNGERQAVIDFYREKASQFSAEKYIKLTGETSQQEQDKIYSLLGKISDDPADDTVPAVLARRTKRNGFVLGEGQDIQDMEPYQFTTGSYSQAKFKTKKTTKSLKTYTTTLYDFDVVHMDISSYYPTLISILQTLKAPSGQDQYNDLRLERIKLKERIPSDPATWNEQDKEDQSIQLANKLLLNAASGAADASYDNNIRVNNKAYRMRISGQLILLALSLDIAEAGGVPNSINTDGVYAHDISEDTADTLIQSWASLYSLEADTEMVDILISKDSNNRIEYYLSDRGESIIASGGTVGNWEGTTLTGNLNRPPIVDRALTYYLINHDSPLTHFDRKYVTDYITGFIQDRLEKAKEDPEEREDLFNYFQTPFVSNVNKNRYIVYKDTNDQWSFPSPINRIFYTKKTEEALQATMVVINRTIKKDNPEALRIADETNLLEDSDYHTDDKVHAGTMKITGADTEQWFTIKNQSTATIDWQFVNDFDIEAYVDSVQDQWDNWAV